MGLTLTTPASSIIPSSALPSVGGQNAPMANADGTASSFTDSLALALDAVTQSVQSARVQLSMDQPQQDALAMQATAQALSALASQFKQALERLTDTTKPVDAASQTGMQNTQAMASSALAQASALAHNTAVPEVANQRQVSTTEQWVRVALNRSIAQSQANGYDPEKSHMVNTLRGYFSGDAQARSNAIHSIDRAMLEAGGAYETNDGGTHAIAGNPPKDGDISMPTFKTAYDKDWSRPSLYDQINSSLGWESGTEGEVGKPVNFADPANRDAILNRKLTDDEVAAFQSGNLSANLKALVEQYRGARI